MKTLLLTLSIGLGLCCAAIAQKLPAIQTTSVKAPTNIKIDGKPNEWTGGLQATNRAINASYTIANDAGNLYLIIQAADEQAVKKIIGGNITLSIRAHAKDSTGSPAAVTFPMLPTESKNRISMPYVARSKQYPPADLKRADSLRMVINALVAAKCKEIDLKGLKGLPDSAISVYNDQGIKAALNFDEHYYLNYELAIPLKYLGLDAGVTDLSYEIRFNHVSFFDTARIHRLANGETVTVVASPRAIVSRNTFDEMNSDTYLKGVYQLAK